MKRVDLRAIEPSGGVSGQPLQLPDAIRQHCEGNAAFYRPTMSTGARHFDAPADARATSQVLGHHRSPGVLAGKSFLRSDEGNELSYDLARILVSQFGAEWDPFRSFVLAAAADDGGAAAAGEHLGLRLGQVLASLLEQEADPAWEPNPKAWNGVPERGAFVVARLPKLRS